MLISCAKKEPTLPEPPEFLNKHDEYNIGDKTSRTFTKAWGPVWDFLEKEYASKQVMLYRTIKEPTTWQDLLAYYQRAFSQQQPAWRNCSAAVASKNTFVRSVVFCTDDAFFAVVSIAPEFSEQGMLPVALISNLLERD